MAKSRGTGARRSERAPRPTRPSELRKKAAKALIAGDPAFAVVPAERFKSSLFEAMEAGLKPVLVMQQALTRRIDRIEESGYGAPSGAGEASGVASSCSRAERANTEIGNVAARIRSIAVVVNVMRSRVAVKHQHLAGATPATGKEQGGGAPTVDACRTSGSQ
jgi:hypothetical protein